MNQQRCAHLAEQSRRLSRAIRRVGRDAGVEGPPGAHGGVERAHRLLERRVRVEAMRVEDVDESSPAASVTGRGSRAGTCGTELAVRSGPHVPAGLGRDEQFVAIGREVVTQDAPEVRLGAAVGRAVVVGQSKWVTPRSNAGAGSRAACPARDRHRSCATTQRDQRKLDAAAPAAPVVVSS